MVYQLIESTQELQNFAKKNQHVDYLCFDTEFVGERRFQTRLCLIQLATPINNYLIDPFKVEDLSSFLDLIQNPNILKITHAGENDYRLLHKLYNILPKNVFDTQIAAGFLGHKYPVSFKKLAKQELNLDIDKGYTVADWESRPFNKEQLNYALLDVIPLQDLYRQQSEKIKKKGYYKWVETEFEELEMAEKYRVDPHREALKNNMMPGLRRRDQLFLIRLLDWRRKIAKDRNQSREMVLPNKYLGHIVKTIDSGKQALLHNRRVPNKIVEKYWEIFSTMYQQKETEEEQHILNKIPRSNKENPYEELLLEFLYLLIKQKAMKAEIASDMAFSRSLLKQIKHKDPDIMGKIKKNWRNEFLGPDLISFLEKFPNIDLNVKGNSVELL